MPELPRGPALPWAAGVPDMASSDSGDEEFEQPLTLEQLGLRPGDRIEVRWVVEPDEGQPYGRWWGGTILSPEQQAPPAGPASASGSSTPAAAALGAAPAPAEPCGPTYRLRYDAFDDFEEEVVPIQLLGEHVLLDVASAAPLDWRREGADYEPPPPGDEEAAEQRLIGGIISEAQWDAAAGEGGPRAPDGSGTLTGGQIAAILRDQDRGSPPDDDAQLLEALGRGDAAQTRLVAAGYRDFVDSLKAFLDAKIAAAGGGPDGAGVLITADDMGEFGAMMLASRGGGRGGGGGAAGRRL